MRNISAIWSGLGNARRGALVGALVAIAVAVLMLGRMGGASETALLYAGLDPRVAGEVVAALEQRGVAYQVQGDLFSEDEETKAKVTEAIDKLQKRFGRTAIMKGFLWEMSHEKDT